MTDSNKGTQGEIEDILTYEFPPFEDSYEHIQAAAKALVKAGFVKRLDASRSD